MGGNTNDATYPSNSKMLYHNCHSIIRIWYCLSVEGSSFYEKGFTQSITRGVIQYNHYLIYTNSWSAGLGNGTWGDYNQYESSASTSANGSYKILENNYHVYGIVWIMIPI